MANSYASLYVLLLEKKQWDLGEQDWVLKEY